MGLEGYLITVSFIYVYEIIISTDMTLLGLGLGVLTMKKGEFSRFLFQPNYAYGEMGCPPFIPAAAEVLYEVHIVDYFDSAQMDDFIALSLVQRSQVLEQPQITCEDIMA